jgi:hypothetical protein
LIRTLPIMTIFAILLPTVNPALAEAIQRVYPTDHLKISDSNWLVSSAQTVIEVSNALQVSGFEPTFVPKGNAVIFATSSYFGRANTNVWDWIKVKLEGQAGG